MKLCKRKKIALIGNQNNNNFALARYLKDSKWDVTLFLTDFEIEKFHPSSDAYDNEYLKYTKKLNWGSPDSFEKTSREKIIEDLSGYDIYIATGLVPAYMQKAGMRIDIFIPHGADIWVWTKYRITRPSKVISYNKLIYFQRRGLAKVKIIHAPDLYTEYEKRLKKICASSERWKVFVPMLYSPEYASMEKRTLAELKYKKKFDKIRAECEILMIFPSRINKNAGNGVSGKGVEVLIDAIHFLNEKDLDKIKIILFEYGRDVDEIKEKINFEKKESVFEWLPSMERKELMYAIHLADVVLGQFGPEKWIQNGVITEALAIGKPIITARDEDYIKDLDLYWALSANNTIELASKIIFSINNLAELKVKSRLKNSSWYQENVRHAIDKYENYFLEN